MKSFLVALATSFSVGIFTANSAKAVSCEAQCWMSCRDILFEEVENQFSGQKCHDYGGNPHGMGASYRCVKYVNGSQTVYGTGALTSDAQRSTFEACQSAPLPCSNLLDTPSKSIIGTYHCN